MALGGLEYLPSQWRRGLALSRYNLLWLKDWANHIRTVCLKANQQCRLVDLQSPPGSLPWFSSLAMTNEEEMQRILSACVASCEAEARLVPPPLPTPNTMPNQTQERRLQPGSNGTEESSGVTRGLPAEENTSIG